MKDSHAVITATLIDDDQLFTLADLCRACDVHAEMISEMIDFGIIEPCGDVAPKLQFSGSCLWRVSTVVRLQSDLGINLAGAALALDLLEELRDLRQQLKASR